MAQSIANPSFEADSFAVSPGYVADNGGGISGWAVAGQVGLNPAASSPFADNGVVPDGSQVAFIQSPGSLATTITGLSVGTAYRVRFRANARALTGIPSAAWSLNGGPFHAFTAFPAVGGANAYYAVSGSFVATGTTAALAIRNQTVFDSTLLVDDFSVAAVPLVTVANSADSGAGSLRQAYVDAGARGHIRFDPALDGATIPLTSGEITLDRWTAHAWTGDADSGIDASRNYTHAFNFGSGTAAVVNGVTFAGVAGGNPAGPGFSLAGPDTPFVNDANDLSAQVSGGSRVLANDFVYNGFPATLTLTGLQANASYRLSLFGVGFDPPGNRLQTFASNGVAAVFDEGALGDNRGIRVDLEFVATGSSRLITVTPQAIASFHFYAFANLRLGNTGVPVRETTIDASDLAGGITISGGGNGRVFRVESGSALVIDNLRLLDGAVPTGGDGGAIYNAGSLTVRNARLAGHSAGHYGGALYNRSGALLSVSLSAIETSTALFAGGIFNGGSASLEDSTLRGNFKSGLYNSGLLRVERCTLSGNDATGVGGGLYNTAPASVVNTTITGNHAGMDGGGIHNSSTGLWLVHCTVADNDTDTMGGGLKTTLPFVMINTIVAENSAGLGSNDVDGALGAGSAGNVLGLADVGLSPLGDYFGPTATMALGAASPAIDAGVAIGLPTDQRGKNRTVDGDSVPGALPDAGAFELNRNVVRSTADSGAGSLRAALDGADVVLFNRDPAAGAVFDGSAAAVITLASPLEITNNPVIIDASANAGRVTLDGGGQVPLLVVDAASIVQIDSVDFVGGRTAPDGDGGAIHNSGILTVRQARIAGNHADHYGGAIYNESGAALTLQDCRVEDNVAPFAGGILNFGSATLERSTLARNQEIGIYNASSLTMRNCTVADNRADDFAGGIYSLNAALGLRHCTVAGNVSSNGGGGIFSNQIFALDDSVVAGNRSPVANDIHGQILSASTGNLIGDGTGLIGPADGVGNNLIGTDLAPFDPRLAPLGDYGGPTPTMPPLVGSPAIDAIPTTVLAADQRGFARVGVADRGAVEAGPVVLVTHTGDAGAGSLRQALADATAPGTRVLFNLSASDQRIVLATGPLVLAAGSNVFLDASRLVDGFGVPSVEVPGVTLSAGNTTRVFEIPPTGNAAFQRVTFSDGIHAAGGGCLWNEGTATLVQTTLTRGEGLTGRGGAIHGTASSRTALHGCTAHANHALVGGAVFSAGRLDVQGSTLSGNRAGSGGALYAAGAVTVANSTLAANSADDGGGAYCDNAAVRVANSIVSGNTAALGGDITNRNSDLRYSGPNLVRSTRNILGGTVGGNEATKVDPDLAPLADNGGPTLTMAPNSTSPAIDATPAGLVAPIFDQRGFPRQLAGGLDIGAVELAIAGLTADSLSLHSNLPQALADLGEVGFAISADRDFLPVVESFAGSGTLGSADGSRTGARFAFPSGMACDSSGCLYVADTGNNRIRKIDPDGLVTTVAGTGAFGFRDGAADEAQFAAPTGIAVAPDDTIYIADSLNHRIRRLVRPLAAGEPWMVETLAGFGTADFADGTGAVARFNRPHGIACDAGGNLFVADTSNQRIRKVTPAGVVTTWAGSGGIGATNGQRLASTFSAPLGVAVDSAGNVIVADSGNHLIRRVGLAGVVTLAGGTEGFEDGAGTAARFRTPAAVAIDAAGHLWVGEQGNHAIRMLERPASPAEPWPVVTVGGTGASGYADGRASEARFNHPTGLCVTGGRDVLVADARNHRLRRIRGQALVVASTGEVDPFGRPVSAAVDASALGLRPGTRYFFRWVAANGRMQEAGQSFFLLSTPFQRWQAAQFGAAADDPFVAGAQTVFADDEVSNLAKYALGIAPGDASGSSLPTVGLGGGLLTLRYSRNSAATDVTFTVECSDDLDSWDPVGITEQVLGSDGGIEQVLATAPAGPGRKFIRLNLILQQP